MYDFDFKLSLVIDAWLFTFSIKLKVSIANVLQWYFTTFFSTLYQRQEQERKTEEEKQKALETLNAKKEADKIFMEKQELKAQKAKEEGKALQDIYIQEMVGIALNLFYWMHWTHDFS